MTKLDMFAPLLDEGAFDQNLNIRVLRLASSLSTIFQRLTLRDKQVTNQEYRILVTIARHGAGHVRDISRKAAMDAAHVSRTTKAMRDKGWLQRSPDPHDKRLVMFAMTEQGRALFWTIYPAADAFAKEFSDLFEEGDAALFRDMLDRAGAHAATLLDEKDRADDRH